jgi:hypothetical protein
MEQMAATDVTLVLSAGAVALAGLDKTSDTYKSTANTLLNA